MYGIGRRVSVSMGKGVLKALGVLLLTLVYEL